MSEPIKTKRCPYCKKIKPLSEFHKTKNRKDGHRAYCKTCSSKYQKEYAETEKGKTARRTQHKLYEVRHPERRNAISAVNNAIKTGKMPRPDTKLCHYCPRPAQEYHHHKGYAPEHWFDVVPVCIKCHTEYTNR